LAEDAARELPNLSLEDLLQLVHLCAERGSPKYERAALRWLERYLGWSWRSWARLAPIGAGAADRPGTSAPDRRDTTEAPLVPAGSRARRGFGLDGLRLAEHLLEPRPIRCMSCCVEAGEARSHARSVRLYLVVCV
jgi:hypothetical protein